MSYSKSKSYFDRKEVVELSTLLAVLVFVLMFTVSKTVRTDAVIKTVVIKPIEIIDIDVVTQEEPKAKPTSAIPIGMEPIDEIGYEPTGIEYVPEEFVITTPPPIKFAGVDDNAKDDEVIAFINVQDPPKLSLSEKEKLLRAITENYPSLAKKSGTEGKVKLSFVCSKEGNPVNIEISSEVPEGLGFGEAAVSALRLVRFTPGYQNDKAVAVRMSQTIGFVLKK
jgi:protein TonB